MLTREAKVIEIKSAFFVPEKNGKGKNDGEPSYQLAVFFASLKLFSFRYGISKRDRLFPDLIFLAFKYLIFYSRLRVRDKDWVRLGSILLCDLYNIAVIHSLSPRKENRVTLLMVEIED